MRDDALEAVGVAENPVNHVAAIAGTQRTLAVLVDEGIRFFGVVETEHQVFEWSAAPIAIDSVNEFLTIAGRAVEVDHYDHVAVGGKQFRIPAKAPVVTPGSLRSAMHKEFHRILLFGIEVGRLEEQAFDFVSVVAGEAERVEF